jgi:tetratricopeptide (TPR) repeat protein
MAQPTILAGNAPEEAIEGSSVNYVSPAATAPAMPPSFSTMKGKTGDEILADLNKSPLFMTTMEENDDIEALKALAYEGNPSEVSLSFKEHGNDAFKEQKYADAKEFFTKAVQVLQAEARKRTMPGRVLEAGGTPASMEESEVSTERSLLEACLANRAACHLKLRNYRSCTFDCAAIIRLNPKNLKAWFRCATALLATDHLRDASDCCTRGLALDPQNPDLLNVATAIAKRHEDHAARQGREAAAALRLQKEVMTLRAALKARNIRTRATAQPPELEDARARLVPDPLDPTSSLQMPVLFLYPLHLQSDFVKDMSELEPVGERLRVILEEPMDWDSAREYRYEDVECYIETITGGLLKIGLAASLLKVLSSGKVEIVDGVVRLYVVPKKSASSWVQEFKDKKAVELGMAT